jgi:hypothetical protein
MLRRFARAPSGSTLSLLQLMDGIKIDLLRVLCKNADAKFIASGMAGILFFRIWTFIFLESTLEPVFHVSRLRDCLQIDTISVPFY